LIRIPRIALLLAFAVCAACQSGDTKRSEPPAAPPAKVVAIDAGPPPVAFTRGLIAVGMAYACVRSHGETLTCWGRSFPNTPTLVSGVTHVAGVVAAQARTCAWTTSGTVYCMDGGAPALVDGIDDAIEMATDPDAFVTCARRKSGHVACWSDFDKPGPVHDVEGISGALEIAVAGTTLCVRDAKGVACWHPQDPVLRRIANTADATSLAGGHFTFAATRKGQPPIAWHESDYGPQPLPVLNADVHQFALGSDAACALGKTLQCWDLASAGKPYEVAAAGATEIAVGYSLGCARMTDHVACWGSTGSLGDGSPIVMDEPVDVANLSDATQIMIAGDEQTCAMRANGHTVCWGTTEHAQTDPAPVEYPSAGKYFRTHSHEWSGSYQRGSWTCTKAAHVTCMMTFYGRHDDGVSTTADETWGNLDSVRDIRMPSNESGDVCVADAHGDVACFPAFEGAERSVAVDGVGNVVELAQYGEETCALEQSGIVKCWNERERRYTGGKVRTLTRITDGVQIVGGSVHTCARHKSGTVSCWGARQLLGDNHDIHQRTPVVVAGVTL